MHFNYVGPYVFSAMSERFSDSPYNFNNPPTIALEDTSEEVAQDQPMTLSPCSLSPGLPANNSPLSQASDHQKGEPHRGRRSSRTRFTEKQLETLQGVFEATPYPREEEYDRLSALLSLPNRIIVVWFQNARQRAQILAKPSVASLSLTTELNSEEEDYDEEDCEELPCEDGPSMAYQASGSGDPSSNWGETQTLQQHHHQQQRQRTQMSHFQVLQLRDFYRNHRTPNRHECEALGQKLGLPHRVVQVKI
uniref:Homeobox domain-containing protein n=1 Tax=Takifugu rubripes TaxID=31033 RepID=A0A3B5K759_TAKRU